MVYLDGASAESILSDDIVMLEVSPEQLDQMKQWQPMTLATSFIEAEIAENGVFDLGDRGNLSNEESPADVFLTVPEMSIRLDIQPANFSPNDDEVKDRVAISYSPIQTSDITIRIRDAQRMVAKEWQVEDQIGGLVYSVEWDGKKPDGSAYPDGEYAVIVVGSAVGTIGFAYGLKQDIYIDNSAPQIVSVRPGEGEEIPPLFRASISIADTPKKSGIESVYMAVDGDIENRFPLAKSETEGEYGVPATSGLLLPLGHHDVSFHVVDMAGNETEERYSYVVVAEAVLQFTLMNFPNPLPPGGTTNIRYSLPEKANKAEMAIYDAGGDMVFFREFVSDELELGEHTFQWDSRNMHGNMLSRGVYFCRLWIVTETEDESKIHKIAIR